MEAERVLKTVTAVLSAVLVPTFGWVWSTDRAVTELRSETTAELAALERRIILAEDELAEVSGQGEELALIQRDIEYIRLAVTELKTALER
jgi:hypothetical protein